MPDAPAVTAAAIEAAIEADRAHAHGRHGYAQAGARPCIRVMLDAAVPHLAWPGDDDPLRVPDGAARIADMERVGRDLLAALDTTSDGDFDPELLARARRVFGSGDEGPDGG